MAKETFYIVNSKILPPVFEKVIFAKELLAGGKAANSTQASKMAGISRSAFYKYKDFVFKNTKSNENIIDINAVLSDEAGVFSALAAVLYQNGANIITVNQEIPVDGVAAVYIRISIEEILVSFEELIASLKNVKGIISFKTV